MSESSLKPFVARSTGFASVIGAEPSCRLVIETNAHEGPVYVAKERALYYTTKPADASVPLPGSKRVAIGRLDLSSSDFPLPSAAITTIREPANMANGMTLDREGRLVVCEQGSLSDFAQISVIPLDSRVPSTLVNQWRGLRFNSPNDVVVKSDGTVWFTDPSYGAAQGFKPAPMVGDFVYRHDPRADETSVVADSFIKPNGLAFSPDETILYINDSGADNGEGDYLPQRPHHIRAFDVQDDRRLVNDRLFAVVTPGIPDGLKVDTAGRVYSSSASGVQVFSPEGDLLGEILAPGVANFTFGGPSNQTLYMLCDTAIYAADIQATGAARPSNH